MKRKYINKMNRHLTEVSNTGYFSFACWLHCVSERLVGAVGGAKPIFTNIFNVTSLLFRNLH
jgi:hypothetical protein